MANHKNLHRAKKLKNDEFYTLLDDITNELKYYAAYFRDKVIYMNCDNPNHSCFWQYFYTNFDRLMLSKIISTHYDADKPTYKLEYTKDSGLVKTPLKQNGDFRSPECLDILNKEADIVVTNPPFSLFREYLSSLITSQKKFIIIGNQNAITYKETFSLIKDGKVWLGKTHPKDFLQPDGTYKTFGNISWFTNLDHNMRHTPLKLGKKYKAADYPKYDNYDAINVDKVIDIPVDYDGVMGVPITFLDKWCPEQFEILGIYNGNRSEDFYVNGISKYARILIRRIK